MAMALAASAMAQPSGAQESTTQAGSGYGDVGEDHFAAPAVAALAALGVLEGTGCGDGQFCPDEAIDRATMAVWMVRVLDRNDPAPVASTGFNDVSADHRWAAHIGRLRELGVTQGCGDGTRFCPDGAVTRDQMAVFLARAFKLEPGPDPGFTDMSETDWFYDQAAALAASGITAGCDDGTRFCPRRDTARAEMAVFLSRAVSRQAGEPSARIDSPSPQVVSGNFTITITFNTPVTGLEVGDIGVVNGTATRLSGSGTAYQADIEPAAPGTVMVRLPAGSALGGDNSPSQASAPFTRTVATAARAAPGFDTWNRAGVVEAHAAEFERTEPDWGYTGDVDSCVAGTTSQAFRNSVIQRVNWYRQMAGLDTVTENSAHSAGTQQTALMMLAARMLSHRPTSNWPCYTSEGAQYAESNLALGVAGVSAMDGFMRDDGAHNLEVGHRRWILYPQSRRMGTGDARDPDSMYRYANALWPRDDHIWDSRPPVREERGFVAWPPSGYVPSDVTWGRWSFSLNNADFSAASVTMADDSGSVRVEIIARDSAPAGGHRSAPEPTIVWAVAGDTDSRPLPAPSGGDHCYTVTITGVRIADSLDSQDPYEYAVCVLDPSL